ncbi:8-amino-7-oxononanoate synthase [Mucilaginibacter sp. Bleaf8]|uniref:aminotransferase class I/II-fold pyridoxal phosphate-dependent enzyme n=1 Tax=Mucilaginibacter sp. Bleaf8 TaxID=2834430 RepID=UPI001BCEB4E5|nr:8-amino-7-oxononanoate synthase [Mucilaginibacter sp. Bleaf8]MBS7563160.1 8-amino-7-oxononanoate synthase [Mucilaginibacter sp. Bleaf8]
MKRLNAAFFIFVQIIILDPHYYIQQKLDSRRAEGLYRQLRRQNQLIDFCSNDYLGFTRSTTLNQMVEHEMQRLAPAANGSAGSRLLAGNTAYAEELEQWIASYHSSETALLFNSGYDANVGLFSSLPQRGDTVIHDELIHASIIDGTRLSHANRYSFKHNDLDALEAKLKTAKGHCYVAVESVYSMDGDLAPLQQMVTLVNQYNASLIVDEAHAIGVFGKGSINQLGLQNEVFARVVTFGKAMGCHGAAVLGSDLLSQYLINFARSFIYTTAAPLHQLATIRMAYKLLEQSGSIVDQVHANIALYNSSMAEHLSSTNVSAIQTLPLGSNKKAIEAAAYLQQNGFDVRPILSPTVAAGTERIRVCLHSFNTAEEIQQLTQHINTQLNAC